MAATESSIPINGTYAHHSYDNYAAAGANSSTSFEGTQPSSSAQSNTGAATSEIPKDEVGWYFVEQYYTTLSKTPEKLYLFYNKRSQYVSGTEEDKVQVCIGQKAINDRIKELDFHDTKVRVTNVDSQGSDANIVIQVIGEISNKGQPHKRFAQTFVLAAQTNGYFVLNDIFRYLAEELEEEEEQIASVQNTNAQEPAPVPAASEAEGLKQTEQTAQSEEDLQKVDEKLDDVVQVETPEAAAPPAAAVNGTPVPETADVAEAEDAPAAAVSTEEEAPTKVDETPTPEPEVLEPEKPKEPSPTPVAVASKPAAAPKPTAPRTWASLAASAHKVATPAVPNPSPAATQTPSQPKSAASAPSQPLAVPAAQTSTPAREASPANSQGDAAGWQPVTGHKKEQSRAQNQAPVNETENKRAYIKNVYSQVDEASLRSVLTKFGDISYLDISRQKNCAFVDFKSLAGYQAAVNNNPHVVNGLDLTVEERRTRPASSFAPFPRGGAPRGRGGIGQGPRGGFQPRGRGGPIRGGRGAPQEA